MNRICQQALDIATGILDTMESILNMFTAARRQTVELRWILERLVGAFSRPDAVVGLLSNLGLPCVANDSLVPENVALFDPLQKDIRRIAFIRVGWHQIVHQRQTAQRGQHHQFVAKVVQVAGGTMSIGGTPGKIAMRLTALVTHDRNMLGIYQQTFGIIHPKQCQPCSPQLLNQITQVSRQPIVLALIHQLRKHSSMIGTNIARVLRFAWYSHLLLIVS